MSDTSDTETTDTSDQRRAFAEAFGRDIDPLAEFETTFEKFAIDEPFTMFVTDVLDPQGLNSRTLDDYHRGWRQWREYMVREGRHPTCPNTAHVIGFVDWWLYDKGNGSDTARQKLYRLNRLYEYWQDEPAFPHPTDFNPFKAAHKKISWPEEGGKEPPRISVERFGEIIRGATNYRDRVILAMQPKLGLRVGELCNMQLQDIHIADRDLQQHYPELGSHPRIGDHENVVYVPHDREGNKSKRPRLIPLDDELRRVLTQYLLIRPDDGEPWVILSRTTNSKMYQKQINEIWKKHFHPEFAENDLYRGVSSHFGRHYFTTHWRVKEDINRELVKYLRGDVPGEGLGNEGIDYYIHTYYEDIHDVYIDAIFKLGL